MRSHFKKIDKISSILFFLGFIFSKLHHIPVYFLSGLFNLVALSLYLLGYLTWLAASFLHPDTARKHDKWYSFAQFKQQHTISALIGTAATALTLATLFLQMLIIPSCWLFVASNVFWCIAEYHKFKNPPLYVDDYSHSQQKSYLAYTISSTSLSLIVAAITTLTFFIPPIAFITVPLAFVVGAGMSLLSFYYWHDSQFGKHEISSNKTSFEKIKEYTGEIISQDPVSHCSTDMLYTSLFEKTADNTLDRSLEAVINSSDDEYDRRPSC